MTEKSLSVLSALRLKKKKRQQRQSCVCASVCVFNLLACLLLYSLFIFKCLLPSRKADRAPPLMREYMRACVCVC